MALLYLIDTVPEIELFHDLTLFRRRSGDARGIAGPDDLVADQARLGLSSDGLEGGLAEDRPHEDGEAVVVEDVNDGEEEEQVAGRDPLPAQLVGLRDGPEGASRQVRQPQEGELDAGQAIFS